ncbi:5'-nucleotidase, lipoprotein e(P4) family [Gracilimonas halophila]|uniref:5'-nucleotidase, lipoprotein e(P4) family n=1 Tax=Gracilimonas halophila TaxID=1834464 RepID=A0ABW5JKZ5_9BACT
MYSQKFGILILLLSVLIGACGSTQQITESDEIPLNKTTQATLWVQNAAEYTAITTQSYNTAQRMLPLSLEDSFWTASLNQQENENHLSLPPAIIMDIDETVLDNSPFQARMIKQNKAFNIADWNAWCNEANADPVSGALEFTNFAAENGVAIFYISNRSYEVEDATRKNLIEKGFPVSDSIDTIMSNGEEPDWNSSKVERRKVVEENYRILMAFGDDLNDFLHAKGITQDKRAALVEENANKFGRMWFVLPNPVYGSWEDALFDFEDDLTEDEQNSILQERLNSKNN